MNLRKNSKTKIRIGEPIRNHTTFKIGGRAKFFIEPKDTDELRFSLAFAKNNKLPVFVIGAGSNILVGDKGIPGVLLRLSSPDFKKIYRKGSHLYAGSGAWLGKIVKFSKDYGLSGAEFLAGIPGTLGGALAMNAGVKARSMGCIAQEVSVMDYSGKIKNLRKKDLRFGYRKSNLSKYIILSAILKLKKSDKHRIRERIDEYVNYRKVTQDLSRPSAGCIFKNPHGDSAGRLIDLCGLKGKRVGDAAVSLKHANFILNLKRASCADVLKLMGIVRKTVNKKFKIDLAPEIKIWD
jgi:UDP-N-acetylmuramate dehydrogenase